MGDICSPAWSECVVEEYSVPNVGVVGFSIILVRTVGHKGWRCCWLRELQYDFRSRVTVEMTICSDRDPLVMIYYVCA